jgi:hypothetical protein
MPQMGKKTGIELETDVLIDDGVYIYIYIMYFLNGKYAIYRKSLLSSQNREILTILGSFSSSHRVWLILGL